MTFRHGANRWHGGTFARPWRLCRYFWERFRSAQGRARILGDGVRRSRVETCLVVDVSWGEGHGARSVSYGVLGQGGIGVSVVLGRQGGVWVEG